MKYNIIIIALLILFLNGCATSTDPHEGGFLGGVQGLSSGEYERRKKERQQRLERIKQEQSNLDNYSQSLEKNKASLEKKLQEEKRLIAKLNKDSQALEEKIAQLKSENSADQKKVNNLKQRLKQLNRDISNIKHSIDDLEGGGSGDTSLDKTRAQLEKQRKELQNEYQLLLEMTLELGQ